MKPTLQQITDEGFKPTGIFLGMYKDEEIYHNKEYRLIYNSGTDEVLKRYTADKDFDWWSRK